MDYDKKELRTRERSYIEPYDTGTYMEFNLSGNDYRFNLLDTSPEGMGMLVKKDEAEIISGLSIGDRIRMEYKTPEASIPMEFEIRHVTRIERGTLKGHHQVGLSFLDDQT
ncbi:PilZ domain-containing protein [Thermodesulfobacteriota bacterium]